MNEIIKYQANDGSVWDSEEKAVKQDKLIVTLESAMAHLKPRPKGCDFTNGKGFVQHEVGAYAKTEANLRKVFSSYYPGPIGIHDPLTCDMWLLMRCVCDSGNRSMNHAFNRLACMCSRNNREFGQPYFVTHQSEVSE